MENDAVALGTPDGPMRLHSYVPVGDAARAVIVIHEALGVTDHVEDVARDLASVGYHAVAPALFHRAGGGTASRLAMEGQAVMAPRTLFELPGCTQRRRA